MEEIIPFKVVCINQNGWSYHYKGEEYPISGPEFKEECTVIGMSFDIGEGYMTYHILGHLIDPNGYGYNADLFIDIKRVIQYEVKEVEIPETLREKSFVIN